MNPIEIWAGSIEGGDAVSADGRTMPYLNIVDAKSGQEYVIFLPPEAARDLTALLVAQFGPGHARH